MTAEVRLVVTYGLPEGVEYVFRDRPLLTVGRAPDCDVRLPNDLAHLDVSRRHCLLALGPNGVRVRDLGSKNGTYLNGAPIGRRPTAEPCTLPPEAGEFSLEDGDELRVGGTVFRVHVRRGREDATEAFSAAEARALRN